MLVHQIWIGDCISGQDATDVADIRNKCEEAGHTHKLWSYDELIGILPAESRLNVAFDTAREALPHTMFASMVTDYFRLYLLREPGLYLDTDVVCTVDKFPEMPGEFDIQMCTNTNRVSPNTCVLHASSDAGASGCAAGAEMVRTKLETEFIDKGGCHVAALADRLKARPFSLIGFVGPSFFNNRAVPAIEAGGASVGLFALPFASSAEPSSILYHRGEGSWCHGGKGNHRRRNAPAAAVWGGLPREMYNI